MKKIFTLILICSVFKDVNAQCSTSSAPLNNCTSYGDNIDSFTLNSISSTGSSGCSSNGYGIFSTPVWSLQIGSTYPFTAGVGGGTEIEGLAIWIDLNNDGFYTDSELMFSSTAPNTSHSGNIAIPYNSVAGTNLSMRVRCSYNHYWGSGEMCGDYLGTWGETEDYKVYLTCPVSGAPTITVSATNTHVCVGESVTLTATGASSVTWSGGVTNGVGFSASSTTNYTVIAGIKGCTTGTTTAVKTISVSTVPLAVAAVSSTNTVCAGSPATLTAGGALNYTWMPVNQNSSTVVVTPTASITYTLRGYNGQGCPGFAYVSMNVNPVPVINAVATPSNLCAGKLATLSVSGALTYSWQTLNSTQTTLTVSPQTSQAYPVLGYNSFGCSSLANAVVVAQPAPTVNVSATKTLICVGNSATLNATGAGTYAWVNGPPASAYQISPTVNTDYTVTGTAANGCTDDAVITVNVFQATIAVSQNTSICIGGAAAINAGPATSYSWNITPGNSAQIFVSPTVSTVYLLDATVIANSSVCKASNSVSVTVNPLPTLTVTAKRANICKGETNTITATGADTYIWNTNVATASFTIKANTAPQTINYSVTGTDANTCKGTGAVSFKVDVCQGLNEEVAGNFFYVFPNPNAGSFSIKAEKAMTLVITNELGQVIRTIEVNNENLYSSEITGLSTGLYFVSEQGNKTSVRNKVVVLK